MATERMPSSLHAQMTRRAISPRLATRIFLNMIESTMNTEAYCVFWDSFSHRSAAQEKFPEPADLRCRNPFQSCTGLAPHWLPQRSSVRAKQEETPRYRTGLQRAQQPQSANGMARVTNLPERQPPKTKRPE